MRVAHGQRETGLLTATRLIAVMTACALWLGVCAGSLSAAPQDDRGVYDRDHKDYHNWDDREDRAYRQWREERHEAYVDYDKLDAKRQREYWKWRHEHGDNDRH